VQPVAIDAKRTDARVTRHQDRRPGHGSTTEAGAAVEVRELAADAAERR
jgi:hypothetical protein